MIILIVPNESLKWNSSLIDILVFLYDFLTQVMVSCSRYLYLLEIYELVLFQHILFESDFRAFVLFTTNDKVTLWVLTVVGNTEKTIDSQLV